jgi:hydroxymethylpyrimidine/phosphomethylpyrimidine kinase
MTHPLRVLSIAGSDSGGGAGIQADLKTFSAFGCFGMTAITAITAQNTQGVRAIQALPPTLLAQQIDAVVEDIGVDAVKIGMLHGPDVVRVVAEAIDRHRLTRVVLDPVMVATSGDRLIAEETVAVLVRDLFPRATVITPNLDEAGWLLGHAINSAEALPAAAAGLRAMGARGVLLKGGHLTGPMLTDLLLDDNGSTAWEGARIETPNTHGTGCTLSSAIACGLARDLALRDAVAQARDYVRGALQAAAGWRLGRGHGPLDHGWQTRA